MALVRTYPRFGRALAWSVPLVVEAAALLRSVGLAWGIGAADLGRALILALTLRLVEMLSDVGVERLLQVSPRRDEPEFLAALQGALALRGVALAALLLLGAPIMTALLADGASAGTFAALAVIPLLRGLLHLDYRRAEARGHFLPLALVECLSAMIMLAALPVVIHIFADERAMLGLLWLQAVAQVGFSHLVSSQPFALRFDRQILLELARFGLPLALNAGLMFLALQADRLLVAGFFGWAEVATYAVAFQLAHLPAQIAGRAAASTLTAELAGLTGDRLIRKALVHFAALGAGFALAFALCAPTLIAVIYGDPLRPSQSLAIALGLAAGLRILRTPYSVLAVAEGRTADPAKANLWRAAALLPALGFAVLGAPLTALALCAVAGEATALWQGARLSRRPRRRVSPLSFQPLVQP